MTSQSIDTSVLPLGASQGGTGITSLGTGVATALGQNVSGSGSIALTTSPSFTTPVLGTPTSGTLTTCTGLPISTGVSGLGTGVATFLGTPSSANLLAALTTSTGTGNAVFATSPTLVTPILGTPTSGTLTNCSGLPISGIASLGTGVASALGQSVTGSGGIALATSPSFTTPLLGTPTSGTLTNCSGLPISGIASLGTGVATALGQAVTGSGGIALATSPSFTTPLLGTPTSGTLTNCSGLPISGIASLGTGVATALAASVTGSGGIALATSPSFTTPVLGTPTSGTLTNCSGLPISGIASLGTGVGTALGQNVSGSGSIALTTSPSFTTPTLGAASATSINFGGSTLSTYDTTGTLTPTFTFATAGDLSVSYSLQDGVYTKLGNMIFYAFRLNFTPTYTTSSGAAKIVVLPVNALNTGNSQLGCIYMGNVTFSGKYCVTGTTNSANFLTIAQTTSAGSAVNLSTSAFPTGTAISIFASGFYFT